MNTKQYIKKYILPYDTSENQLAYERGELEYDSDYIKEHKLDNEEWHWGLESRGITYRGITNDNTREITYDDTRDVAIRCVESLIGMGILEDNEDCNGTFEVQDLIQMEINKVLKLDTDNNFKIQII